MVLLVWVFGFGNFLVEIPAAFCCYSIWKRINSCSFQDLLKKKEISRGVKFDTSDSLN